MKQISVMALLPITFLAGCVTAQATAEEHARCEEMARGMGTRTIYNGQTKGSGYSPMNLTHRRCRQILRQSQ